MSNLTLSLPVIQQSIADTYNIPLTLPNEVYLNSQLGMDAIVTAGGVRHTNVVMLGSDGREQSSALRTNLHHPLPWVGRPLSSPLTPSERAIVTGKLH